MGQILQRAENSGSETRGGQQKEDTDEEAVNYPVKQAENIAKLADYPPAEHDL